MLRKVSSKLKSKKESQKSKNNVDNNQGAAVPYFEEEKKNKSENGSAIGAPRSPRGLAAATAEGGAAYLLNETAARGDVDGVRELLKAGADINGYDEPDKNTALHRAAARGQSRVIQYLLMKGADIEAKDRHGLTALYVAVQNGQTGTVGVLVDYMHSVDNRPRGPFVLINATKPSKRDQALFTKGVNCSAMKAFKKQGYDTVRLLICHGQKSEDLAIFLYSILDVPVMHAFFLNTVGDTNMKNFQRFESKVKSQSVTVLNTLVKSVDIVGYEQLRCLILVSCDLLKITLNGLPCLELLDLRNNKLDSLPDNINECVSLKTLKCANNNLRRLPRELGDLSEKLIHVNCSFNHMKRLTSHIVKCTGLRVLECSHNGLLDLPMDIALLSKLEELVVHSNKLSQLPVSVSTLTKLRKISFHNNPLQNIPRDFPERASEVREYLKCLQDDPIPNRTVKLVLVGQEGVGKSTLLKALKRTFWAIPRTPTILKTDGIDVKDIQLDDLTLRCFDCGGDVDFNETHNFFITQGALYLACFNLAEYTMSTVERGSFLLGRLQLWLQYIFSKVPNSQVIIIGTHADHDSLTRPVFEEIWEQLRTLLVSAREHHRTYFRRHDRLADCLLCQSDSRCLRKSAAAAGAGPGFVNLGYDDAVSSEDDTSFADGPESVVSFPHIVGYYEVSSVKSRGNSSILQVNTNQSIEHLKDAIKELSHRLIDTNPTIPRRWANVQESLRNHIEMNPENCISSITEVSKIARAQGVRHRSELLNMLQFLKAQGGVLYFPQVVNMEDIVILDAEWLAKIFSSVVSYRETGISAEGFIDRDEMKGAWETVDADIRDNILTLLRHFGLCLPVSDTNMELFPCKLPLGEPDEQAWPASPSKGERQLTYSITFPSIIPPPLFSELIVMIYNHRVEHVAKDISKYFANQILDILTVDKIGCSSCGIKSESPREKDDPNLYHKVHIEMIAHRRNICITVRGILPCCMMRKVGKLLNKVVTKYEGLGTLELDTMVCPGCHMQKNPQPHRWNVKRIFDEVKKGEKLICSNAHVLPEPSKLIIGVINDSCLAIATVRPKNSRDMFDFSGCPKLPLMLPVNKGGLSFDTDLKLFVSSLLFDGFAVHLLCEFPDGYHLTNAPGYRLKKPKEFMEAYGSLVYSVLHLLKHMSDSTVSAKFSRHTRAVASTITDLIADLTAKFPHIKDTSANLGRQELVEKAKQYGATLSREDLRKFLNVADKPAAFGALRRLQYGDQLLWLCNEHYRQLRMLTIGTTRMVQGLQSYIESSV